jgi:hypothetical protein
MLVTFFSSTRMYAVCPMYILERSLFTGHFEKGKGKIHPRSSHEGPEGEYKYSSNLSLTSALDGGGGVHNATPRPLYPRERHAVPIVQEAHFAPGPVWTGAGKSCPHRDSTHFERYININLYHTISVFPKEKAAGHEAAAQLLVLMLRMCGAIPPFSIFLYVLHKNSIVLIVNKSA